MNKITLWGAINESGKISHNHIEDGWVEGEYPQPIKKEFTNQLAWKNMKWNKKFGYLNDGKVVY